MSPAEEANARLAAFRATKEATAAPASAEGTAGRETPQPDPMAAATVESTSDATQQSWYKVILSALGGVVGGLSVHHLIKRHYKAPK